MKRFLAIAALSCLLDGTAIAAGEAPEMVTVAPGSFLMGSADHGPAHMVQISRAFAVAKYPVTVAEFARFVKETGYDIGKQCVTHVGTAHGIATEHGWNNPGFPQTVRQPVVCVSWNDAQAYAAWLSKRTGRAYRLLSEAEYEYVNRAGSTGAYWWGEEVGRNHAACDGCGSSWDAKQSAPVGSFAPNPFGLYDTSGNVWSWTQDCWNVSYVGLPADGSAATQGDCDQRTIRGGSWGHDTKALQVTDRHAIQVDIRDFYLGFRLARTL